MLVILCYSVINILCYKNYFVLSVIKIKKISISLPLFSLTFFIIKGKNGKKL